MTLEKVDLKNLPAVWKKKTEIAEQIEKEIDEAEEAKTDGSAMTVNPEEKFRKKRVVTPAKEAKYKRVAKVQEFLNYCRFRIGELEVCEKPSSYVIKVFYNYKANRLDKIPQGYMAAINTHKDLVNKAVNVDLRSTSNTNNAKAAKQAVTLRNRAKENFEHWLRVQLGLDNGEKKVSVAYAQYVRRWQLHKKEKVINNLADYIRAICEEYANKLKAYVVLPEGRLVTCGSKKAKDYLNSKRVKHKSKEAKELKKEQESMSTIVKPTEEELKEELQDLRNKNAERQRTVDALRSALQRSKAVSGYYKSQFKIKEIKFADAIEQKDAIISELTKTIDSLQERTTKSIDRYLGVVSEEKPAVKEEKAVTYQNDILDALTTMLNIKGVKDFHITF